MKALTKNELVKNLKGKKLARIYCGTLPPLTIEEKMLKFPNVDELVKEHRLVKERSNDLVFENINNKVTTICDLRNISIYEIDFNTKFNGYLIQFLNKETKEIRSSVLYVA